LRRQYVMAENVTLNGASNHFDQWLPYQISSSIFTLIPV